MAFGSLLKVCIIRFTERCVYNYLVVETSHRVLHSEDFGYPVLSPLLHSAVGI